MNKTIFALLIPVALGACSSVELAPRNEDADAKRFTSVEDKSVVYVVQTGGYGSSRVLMQATLNGQYIAALNGNTFARVVVNPGSYRLALSTAENQEAIRFEVSAGDVVYFGANSKIGWTQMRVSGIQRLAPQVGQQAVRESSLTASAIP